ncbi:hypothetical protein [Paludisphaera mucosa]|uniref:Zinc finger/thioredoxin putative domain-containing protein n=1 Tax=Paludisphaera mucosa TaxID=3030827 RepID=A0ABT6F717_9BACT|nr:hypothetical protein [Paludisphaera mucosa]MDG3003208.1 hypothetical protein [Paludisphaera mucosa]
MPRTISCEQCKTVLNLPDQVPAGKRLKCPKCAHRFTVTPNDANSASTRPGEIDAANTSTYEIPKGGFPILDDLPSPRAEGDLRETFDLPMLAGDAEKSIGNASAAISDAAALFKEETRRKKKAVGAEARAHARRCSRCGGLVPKGMSLCPTCGTDQDTGMHIGLEDDLYPPPPPPPSGIPLHIAIPGIFCALAGGLLTLLAIIQSVRVPAGMYQYGWLMLGVVAGYGVYGSVQFLRGKSLKVLLLALTLGAIVDVIALIGVPIFEANFADQSDVVTRSTATADDPYANELSDYEYKPLVDRLDQQRITLGVTFIIVYALFSVYLNSPPVKRFFAKRQAAF